MAHSAGWGQLGIWWGIFFAKLLGLTVLIIWFSRGTWQEKAIDENRSGSQLSRVTSD